ncbi:MAG TPA: aminotransferase class III-fold pyridoxal phosphate-dependent enzyme [Gaiellaceae bacterium]|nr:aminotransferase class III-fold pyridoxal phosphate-dependent enzyme [Gaiellaceae bacterium]
MPAVAVAAGLEAAFARYAERNPESLRLHEERARVLPGGNTRTTIHLEPFPLTIVRGEAARLRDADGHEYADLLGEYTAGLLGHSHPAVVAAIREALADGLVLGATNRYEAGLAERICARFPSIQLVRFANSGTEANLLALSLAREATGRPAVLVFSGGYHGSLLAFGHGGSPLNVPFPFVRAEYNDAEGALGAIAEHGHELAAVIVEPVQGSGGVIAGDEEFLRALRAATEERGILLVFDEVMTSRLSAGGMQEALGIAPDLTTLGKYVGGGLSFGAFGGRADLLERFDPSRPDALTHGGTFNNEVLTMAAGAAALDVLTAAEIGRVNALGDRLRERLNAFAAERGLEFCATGRGSMVGLHPTAGPVRREGDLPDAAAWRTLLHLHALERGYSYGRRGFVALSLPLGEAEVDGFAAVVEEFLAAA